MWSRLVILALPSLAHAGPVEVELGAVNAPQGSLGVRAIGRLGAAETGIAVGAGLGLTGLIATVGIDQPVLRERRRVVSLYAAYALGTLRPWSRVGMFSAADDIIVDGRYHWIDAGAAVRYRSGRYFIGGGAGIAVLVGHPDPIGRELEDEEPYLWLFSASGWTRVQHWGPTIWTCAGIAL